MSVVAQLMRILSVGRRTATEISMGRRQMTMHQEILLEEYNKGAGPEYQIRIGGGR